MEMRRERRAHPERGSSHLRLSLEPKSQPFLNFPLPEKPPRKDRRTVRQPCWKREGEKSSPLSPTFLYTSLCKGSMQVKRHLLRKQNHLLHTWLHFNKIQVYVTLLTSSMLTPSTVTLEVLVHLLQRWRTTSCCYKATVECLVCCGQLSNGLQKYPSPNPWKLLMLCYITKEIFQIWLS